MKHTVSGVYTQPIEVKVLFRYEQNNVFRVKIIYSWIYRTQSSDGITP